MTFQAQVNGVNVWSDKRGGVNIYNSRIEFGDGSWCDVRTGEIVNKGSGTIRLNGGTGDKSGSDASDETITTEPRHFTAPALLVENIFGDVNIEVGSGPDIELVLEGAKPAVEAIVFRVRGDTLTVAGDKHGSDVMGVSAVKSVISRTRRSRFGGSNTTITQSSFGTSGSLLTVTLKVPVGTAVSLNKVNGHTVIGDIKARLAVTGSSVSSTRAGQVSDLHAVMSGSSSLDVAAVDGPASLTLSGVGKATIGQLNGDANCTISGSGSIKVGGGQIGQLNAGCSGVGSIDVQATADNATLSVSGSGSINVHRVLRNPVQSKSGVGSIKVGQIG